MTEDTREPETAPAGDAAPTASRSFIPPARAPDAVNSSRRW